MSAERADRGDFRARPTAAFLQWREEIDAENDRRCESLVSHLTAADLPDVVALYDQESENRRWWSVRALAELGQSGETGVLLRALEDPSADIRAAASHCVVQVVIRIWEQEPESATELLNALTNRLLDDLGFVRQSAADALAQLGERAIPVLRGVLKSEDESARTRAAYALRKMQNPEAAQDFYTLLEDRNPMVRLYAREALEDMGLLDMAYFRP